MNTVRNGFGVVLALAVYVALAALVFGRPADGEGGSGGCAGLSDLLDGRPLAVAATLCRVATASVGD